MIKEQLENLSHFITNLQDKEQINSGYIEMLINDNKDLKNRLNKSEALASKFAEKLNETEYLLKAISTQKEEMEATIRALAENIRGNVLEDIRKSQITIEIVGLSTKDDETEKANSDPVIKCERG